MTQNAVTPQYRYLLSQLKRRRIAGSFLPVPAKVPIPDILLSTVLSVKHFGVCPGAFHLLCMICRFFSVM